VLLAGAGVGMPEAVDLPCQEALRLRNNRSLTEQLLGSQQDRRGFCRRRRPPRGLEVEV